MSDGDGTKRVLVVGTEPAVVSATVSILAELGRTAVPIDPRARPDEMPADALVIVVCPDRDPHVGAWARAYHRRAPSPDWWR